ncbi:MAG: hypothetical protein LBK41_08715 [Clostridiales bacterium]|nr:hypothetical protein [Clostridiales bacterium]
MELYHYGVLGMKWGIRRTPEQLGRRKFDEAKSAVAEAERVSSASAKGLDYCNRLFAAEREFAGLSPEDRPP